MQLDTILSPGRTLCDVPGSSKKRVLENAAHLICEDTTSLNPNQLFDSLIARERLGSTGLGNGIAIPHGRLKHGKKTIAAFIQLDNGIDYDAVDKQPVDLLFALIVPEDSTDEHLQTLAKLAEMFSNPDLVSKLRQSNTSTEIYTILTG